MSNRLAPFNPTHESAIDIAINLLDLQSTDVLFDLGCGDGRMLLRAANKISGLRCVGIEIDESLVSRGRQMAIAKSASEACSADVADRVEIRNADVLEEMDTISSSSSSTSDNTPDDESSSKQRLTLLNDATAIFVYLLPDGLRKIKLLLEEAAKRRKATGRGPLRVASYIFSISGWNATQIDHSAKGGCAIYLYEL